MYNEKINELQNMINDITLIIDLKNIYDKLFEINEITNLKNMIKNIFSFFILNFPAIKKNIKEVINNFESLLNNFDNIIKLNNYSGLKPFVSNINNLKNFVLYDNNELIRDIYIYIDKYNKEENIDYSLNIVKENITNKKFNENLKLQINLINKSLSIFDDYYYYLNNYCFY